MSMVSESRQETAKRVRQAWVMNDLGKEGDLEKLETRIETALKERDERAAKIVQSHLWGTLTDGDVPESKGFPIARRLKEVMAAIRNEDTSA